MNTPYKRSPAFYVFALLIAFIIMMLLETVTAYSQSSQSFTTMVTTNTGKYMNAVLNDNIFFDFSVTPTALKAKRYIPNVKMVPAVVLGYLPNSMWLPENTAYKLNKFSTVEVYVNGIYLTPLGDYKLTTVNEITYVQSVHIPQWQESPIPTPYLVQSRLQP